MRQKYALQGNYFWLPRKEQRYRETDKDRYRDRNRERERDREKEWV